VQRSPEPLPLLKEHQIEYVFVRDARSTRAADLNAALHLERAWRLRQTIGSLDLYAVPTIGRDHATNEEIRSVRRVKRHNLRNLVGLCGASHGSALACSA
jgi:hypothetical protein